MLLTIFSRAIFLLGIVSALTNPYLIPAAPHGSTQFLVFHSELKSNYNQSLSRCIELGGDLVDIDSLPLLGHLSSRIHNAAFISAFRGERYSPDEGDECAAVYPGGAVAIPQEGCNDLLDSICEIPLLGTGVINVGGIEVQGIENDVGSVRKHAFYRVNMDRAEDVKASGYATTRIVLQGSIETNPALPCCKCCGD